MGSFCSLPDAVLSVSCENSRERRGMKGQYILVNEVLLFILGIFIVYFVASSFSSIQEGLENITTYDHMNSLSEFFVVGILKAYESGENSTLILKMPEYFSTQTYRITANGNNLTVAIASDPRIKVTRELFNISASKIITGSITSSVRYILISNNDTHIELGRLSGG